MPNEAVTTAVAIRDETSAVMLTNAQLQMIANTSFVPAAFRGKVPEVLACVATGRALGLPDMTALRGINIIEGKATLSAELMVAIVRAHGHSITGTASSERALAKGKRRDNGDEMEAEWTMAQAERIQMRLKGGGTKPLVQKDNWKNYPEAMLWARAVSQLCRMLFADCFAGASYVTEEVEATADETLDEAWTTGELVESGGDEIGHAQSGEPVAPSGSTSPWAQLTALAREAGIGKETVVEALRERFPGRRWNELSEDDCAVLRDALAVGAEA